MRPKVTVVVTTFDHARFLDDALRSIASQTRPVQQIVVVDDGSSDSPETVVHRYPGTEIIRQTRRAERGAQRRARRGQRRPDAVPRCR